MQPDQHRPARIVHGRRPDVQRQAVLARRGDAQPAADRAGALHRGRPERRGVAGAGPGLGRLRRREAQRPDRRSGVRDAPEDDDPTVSGALEAGRSWSWSWWSSSPSSTPRALEPVCVCLAVRVVPGRQPHMRPAPGSAILVHRDTRQGEDQRGERTGHLLRDARAPGGRHLRRDREPGPEGRGARLRGLLPLRSLSAGELEYPARGGLDRVLVDHGRARPRHEARSASAR